MNGTKVNVANVDCGRSGSAFPVSSGVSSCASWGYRQGQAMEKTDGSLAFLRMLKEMFPAPAGNAPEGSNGADPHPLMRGEDSELEQMRGVAMSGKRRLQQSSKVHDAADGEMPEDEQDEDKPARAMTTSAESLSGSVVATAVRVPLPIEARGEFEEMMPLDQSSPSSHIGEIEGGEVREGGGNLLEISVIHDGEGVGEVQADSSMGIVEDAATGECEPSIYPGEYGGEALHVAGDYVTNGLDGRHIPEGFYRDESGELVRAATVQAQFGVGEGRETGGSTPTQPVQSVQGGASTGAALASKEAGSKPVADLENTMLGDGDLALFNDVESALVISGVSHTGNLAGRGQAVQMETMERAGEGHGPYGPQRTYEIEADRGSLQSTGRRNAQAEVESLAGNDGGKAMRTTDSTQQATLTQRTENADGNRTSHTASFEPETFFAVPDAESVAVDMLDTTGVPEKGLDGALGEMDRSRNRHEVGRNPHLDGRAEMMPEDVEADMLQVRNHLGSFIGDEDNLLKDDLPRFDALGRAESVPSGQEIAEGRSMDAEAEEVHNHPEGANMADASVHRAEGGSRRNESGEPQIDVNVASRDEDSWAMQQAAAKTEPRHRLNDEAGVDDGGDAAAGHGHEMEMAAEKRVIEPRSRRDVWSESQPQGDGAVLERNSEAVEPESRRTADNDGIRIGLDGIRANAGDMQTDMVLTEDLSPAGGNLLTEEAGRSVMQQIAAHIEARRGRQSGEFRAKLVPESLGEVRIRIRVQGETCTATIQVANGEVGDYIEQHGTDLKVLLAEGGIDLADLSVSVGTHSPSGDGQEWAQAQHAATTFADGGHRGRRDYGPMEPWFRNSSSRDALAAQEVGHTTASMGSRYGRIDYFA